MAVAYESSTYLVCECGVQCNMGDEAGMTAHASPFGHEVYGPFTNRVLIGD
jgi:hypothetical protein